MVTVPATYRRALSVRNTGENGENVGGAPGELPCGILGGAVLCEFQPSLRHDQERSLQCEVIRLLTATDALRSSGLVFLRKQRHGSSPFPIPLWECITR
jgi:hypothetical protein